jgi:hypothetical protein
MNSAEYVSVLVSIVVGLALTDVLQSLHRLLRAGRRVRWDWAAPLSTLLVVMVLVMLWWAFYQPAAGRISIGEFLPPWSPWCCCSCWPPRPCRTTSRPRAWTCATTTSRTAATCGACSPACWPGCCWSTSARPWPAAGRSSRC